MVRSDNFTCTRNTNIAVKVGEWSFVTTCRGKKETEIITTVEDVDHDKRVVRVGKYSGKASLNAPLFHHIFSTRKKVKYILHFHSEDPRL